MVPSPVDGSAAREMEDRKRLPTTGGGVTAGRRWMVGGGSGSLPTGRAARAREAGAGMTAVLGMGWP